MFPRAFDYSAPQSLSEALSLMVRHGDEAKVMAGGQNLIQLMKLRFLSPSHVIDLGRLAELRGIEEKGGEIRCGAMVRHGEIERSDLIRNRLPLLGEAAQEIADVQVRNRGTLGGSLAQADPAGDWPTVSIALGARIRCVSNKGERYVRSTEFFKDTYTTALEPGEILTDVYFPIPGEASQGAYVKIHRRAGDFAIASVAIQLTMNGKRCRTLGLGLGGVGVTPVHPKEVIDFLQGKELAEATVDEACALLTSGLEPIEDMRGTPDYKRRVAGAAFKRAVHRVIQPNR